MIQKFIYADILLPDQPTPITRSFGDSIRAGGLESFETKSGARE